MMVDQCDNEDINTNVAVNDKEGGTLPFGKEIIRIHELCGYESVRVWDGGVFVCRDGCGRHWP